MPTENDAISVVHPQSVCPDFEQLLADLRNAAENNDDEATLNVLRAAIPEYQSVPVEACAPSLQKRRCVLRDAALWAAPQDEVSL